MQKNKKQRHARRG